MLTLFKFKDSAVIDTSKISLIYTKISSGDLTLRVTYTDDKEFVFYLKEDISADHIKIFKEHESFILEDIMMAIYERSKIISLEDILRKECYKRIDFILNAQLEI